MDEKFVRLFEAELSARKKKFKCTMKATKTEARLDLQAARLSQRGGSSGMNYVTHHRYKELALCGERLNIPYGTELHTEGYSLVLPDGREVCYSTSENAKKHFARNDDGRGLERGALTYAIAYSNRERYSAEGRRQRFSDEEIEMLERKWGHFLRQDLEVILFNEDFFAAEPEELQKARRRIENQSQEEVRTMYAIISDGVLLALCDKPRYVRKNEASGAYVEAEEAQAEGISVNGDLYNIGGGSAIPDAPQAVITEGEVSEYVFRNRARICGRTRRTPTPPLWKSRRPCASWTRPRQRTRRRLRTRFVSWTR